MPSDCDLPRIRHLKLGAVCARFRFVMLVGATGTGKTALLRQMILLGAQALDLEALAGHRGSIFGPMAGVAPPTPGDWLERITQCLDASDPARPIWVEEKGSYIGRLTIPRPLLRQFRSADVVEVRCSLDVRVAHLASEYASHCQIVLLQALRKIRRRMPPGVGARAGAMVVHGQIEEAIRLILPYYDSAYAVRGQQRLLRAVEVLPAQLGVCAQQLMDME